MELEDGGLWEENLEGVRFQASLEACNDSQGASLRKGERERRLCSTWAPSRWGRRQASALLRLPMQAAGLPSPHRPPSPKCPLGKAPRSLPPPPGNPGRTTLSPLTSANSLPLSSPLISSSRSRPPWDLLLLLWGSWLPAAVLPAQVMEGKRASGGDGGVESPPRLLPSGCSLGREKDDAAQHLHQTAP